jgi:hypothetical protein
MLLHVAGASANERLRNKVLAETARSSTFLRDTGAHRYRVTSRRSRLDIAGDILSAIQAHLDQSIDGWFALHDRCLIAAVPRLDHARSSPSKPPEAISIVELSMKRCAKSSRVRSSSKDLASNDRLWTRFSLAASNARRPNTAPSLTTCRAFWSVITILACSPSDPSGSFIATSSSPIMLRHQVTPQMYVLS